MAMVERAHPPSASVLVMTDIVHEALHEAYLDVYSNHDAYLESRVAPIKSVMHSFKEGSVTHRTAAHLLRKAVEQAGVWNAPDVSFHDVLERNNNWDSFVEELCQDSYNSGFPEWYIYSSEPLELLQDIYDTGDPFAVLPLLSHIPDILLIAVDAWLFILNSDQARCVAPVTDYPYRPMAYIEGKKIPLVEFSLHNLSFGESPHSQDGVLCYAIPALIEDAIFAEVTREAARRGCDNYRTVWHDIVNDELGW